MGRAVVSKGEVRPIRSLVYVGAANEAAVTRAVEADGDALFLDLEEPQFPYGPTERQHARQAVGEYLNSLTDRSQRTQHFVRVNAPATGLTIADLAAVLTPSLTGVLLPKTSGASDVHMLDGILTCMETERGLPVGSTQVFPLLETAEGVRDAFQVAAASPRVTYMGGMTSRFGDIYQAIRYRWTPRGDESLYLRSKVLMDARSAGIRYPVSGVWAGWPNDAAGIRTWAEAQRDLGYFGMFTDPDGIGLAHDVFTPTADDIEFWAGLIAYGESASRGGDSTFLWPDGQRGGLHAAYLESARMNLQWAQELGL
ncbi:HpcH/HpaI aldolase/citrate lyase family protein [Streptomyces rhizosphaericus]|uniref:CoA ester lyase n=1 Tax=Streptomyces rhizosphaericus TaxID=114699 RepID=A0A6G4A993_9ACTN|nr:aldolase/citrate lyase family protein [Streptomyces rhizosphaericus]NEW69269.1 CoA ester lyase [Streptomyces rhizosphaericus]